jgi:Na+-transporting methylmalonyl-CoA/oxaloacetate decarboxylase gamma subunit
MILEGLRIAVIGMAWVFAGLCLVWGLIVLLNRVFPHRDMSAAQCSRLDAAPRDTTEARDAETDARAAERAEVAAIVATALLSGALPMHPEAPVETEFEHGRTAPNWVTVNRARTLHPWQPPRHLHE